MQWQREGERTPAWEIWNLRFTCSLPYSESLSDYDLKTYGMVDTGDKDLNRQQANQQVMRSLTINEMVEYHKKGSTLYLIKKSDSKKIYDIISNHLEQWKTHLSRSFHIRDAPLDDLMQMDDFAATVYEHAKRLMTKDYMDSITGRLIENNLGFSPEDFLKKETVVAEDGQEEEVYPQRDSMRDTFRAVKAVRTSWR